MGSLDSVDKLDSLNNPLWQGAFEYELLPLGDSAVIIRLGDVMEEQLQRKVTALMACLGQQPFSGMIECVPAFVSVTVHYHPLEVLKSRLPIECEHATVYETVCGRLQLLLSQMRLSDSDVERSIIEVPVCYGGLFGEDLSFVAEHNGMTEEEVIKIHTSATYLVCMIGFAPGFPYLSGMSERIAAPRQSSPRTIIPRGSVGIAGGQTGIYPISTPGGWQLIGRTPLELFRPEQTIPSLLRAGDYVKFKPISNEQYELYIEGVS